MGKTETLEKELKGTSPESIILIETSAEDAAEVSFAAIKSKTDSSYSAVILSANRPYKNLIANYKRNSIEIKKIFVVDCISKPNNAELEESENVEYLESASDLNEMFLSLKKFLEGEGKKKFIFIDSITTLLVFNQPKKFAKFVHLLLTMARIKEYGGLLVALSGESNEDVRAEIAQLCDKVAKI